MALLISAFGFGFVSGIGLYFVCFIMCCLKDALVHESDNLETDDEDEEDCSRKISKTSNSTQYTTCSESSQYGEYFVWKDKRLPSFKKNNHLQKGDLMRISMDEQIPIDFHKWHTLNKCHRLLFNASVIEIRDFKKFGNAKKGTESELNNNWLLFNVREHKWLMN